MPDPITQSNLTLDHAFKFYLSRPYQVELDALESRFPTTCVNARGT